MTECSSEQLAFPALIGKPVVVDFMAPETSSDSGLLLLREADRELGLTQGLAACLHDGHEPREGAPWAATLLLG